MNATARFYVALADALLVLHVAFVAFVVVGLVLIWIGRFAGWRWVRNFSFRVAHLLAMGVVLLETLGGVDCPLTVWEDRLRVLAGGGERYAGSFLQHWLHRLLFYDASETVFQVAYTLFFLLLALSLWIVKPRWPRRNSARAARLP
jgi:hypothetical protein